jgi:hypothetical protein
MGRAWIETNGTIPALIAVVERFAPPADLEKESGLFRRCALRAKVLSCVGLGMQAKVCSPTTTVLVLMPVGLLL